MASSKNLFEQLSTSAQGYVTDNKGNRVNISDLKGKKVIGVYFSAHWCPPCRGFTPVLAKIYQETVAKNESFEIIFVSSDRDEASFGAYFKEMPWKALSFEDRTLKAKLSQTYEIQGIPSLLLFDENGDLVDEDGRSSVQRLPFPFRQ